MNYRPQFYKTNKEEDRKRMAELKELKNPEIFDSIDSQLLELLHCRNPHMSKTEVQQSGLIEEKLKDAGLSLHDYGVWVYYSWKNQLVHILDEEEFIEVRTNRNKYKITQKEQDILRTKKVGIAGLSVGRAVAMTIALERIAGEIRLADFDFITLSNLNRINASLTEMGTNKSIATAKEIAELDPFIEVVCLSEGLTSLNLKSFFTSGGLLDLFIEECDDIEIKINSRLMAKELKVPVIMETNDNCIIDIERFDLEPEREIFHGRLNQSIINGDKLNSNITEKRKVISKIIDSKKLTHRMQISLPDIGQKLSAWPQLASEVNYGGGILCEVSRKILLKKTKESNQFYCANWDVQ